MTRFVSPAAFRGGKFWVDVRLTIIGDVELELRSNAVLDTGSPYTCVPGLLDDQGDDYYRVKIPANLAVDGEDIELRSMGVVQNFGGVGGQKVDRPKFLAELSMDGYDYDELFVVFFPPGELDHVIVGNDVLMKRGGACFSPSGYRPKLCTFPWL